MGRSLAVFWASWGCLGGSQEGKNADNPMRKPLFWKLSFWHLGAPLGSLRLIQISRGPVLGPRWLRATKAPQNWSKNWSKIHSSFGLRLDLFWDPFWDPKRCPPRGPLFNVFQGGFRIPFWFIFLLLLGFSWAQLGPSWLYLGLILVSSWRSWPL